MYLLIAVALLTTYQSARSTIPYFSPRSQSSYLFHRLIDEAYVYQANLHEEHCGTRVNLSVTPEYRRSWDADNIVRCIFGPECLHPGCKKPTIGISGSRVPNRNPNNWLADYFGLPTDYQSCITFEPEVDTFTVYFDSQVNFDIGCGSFYVGLFAPFVTTRWQLGFRECILDPGTANHVEGYFAPEEVERNALLNNFSEFIGDEEVPNLGDTVTFKPLRHGKWITPVCNKLTEAKLSDVVLFLGWETPHHDRVNASIFAIVAAPTGNTPHGEFLFEPVIGNGGSWEVGAGLTAAVVLWDNPACDSAVSFHIAGSATHLFTAHQCRSFDLKNKCNSRYMLAEKINVPVDPFLWANENPGDQNGSVQPFVSFKNILTPVANLTHAPIKVSVDVQGEAAALINYTRCGFSAMLGYNFWGRTCEKICLDADCTHPYKNIHTWALKGDAHVFGFAATGVTGLALSGPVPLSATENLSTIKMGTNNFTGPNNDDGGLNGIRPTRNPGVDNVHFARLVEDNIPGANINDLLTAGEQIETSLEPITLRASDVDICGAQTKGKTHSLFFNFGYTVDSCNVTPYIGIGGSVEWAPDTGKKCDPTQNENCKDNEPPCTECALSQWSVWLKAGVSFY